MKLRYFFPILSAALMVQTGFALTTGDIAFTGFNASGNDDLAFVALSAIPAGTEIFFTDNEWNGSTLGSGGAFNTGEMEFKWVAPAGGVAAGVVVTLNGVGVSGPTASLGSVSHTIGTNLGISAGADIIYAFEGATQAPTVFLSAITNAAVASADAVLTGTGLAYGTNAVALPSNSDGGEYKDAAPRAGQATFGAYAAIIADVATNWVSNTTGGTVYLPFNTDPFSAGAIANSLTLAVSPTSFSESATNPAAVGTVTRSNVTASDLVVTLTSPDTTELTVPATVTILANQPSQTFDVTAQDDSLPDGNQLVTITASAPASTGTSFGVTVLDDSDVLPATALQTGDIAFTCFNGDRDAVAFVALDFIPGGAVIHFCDSEWDGSVIDGADHFATGEGDITWTAPVAGVPAGTVIVIDTYDATATANIGTASGSSGLSASDESIYAYQGLGVRQPVTFLAFISNHNDGTPDSIANTGLTFGSTALLLPNGTDLAEYKPAERSGQATFPAYLPLIGNTTANWTSGGEGSYAGTLCDATNFTLAGPPASTVSIGSASISEGNSLTSTLALNVTRSDTAADFTVNYAVTGGDANASDYTLASGMLTFPASGAATLPITITVIGDTDPENDETVVVTLSGVNNTVGTTTIGTASGTGTILNDDPIPPTITTQPTSTSIISGGVTTLLVAASGSPAPTLQWYRGNTGDITNPVVGATSPIFVTPALNVNTSYWARATNVGNTADSSAATVTIVPAVTSVDLATYIRTGRHNLPHPSRDPAPANNLLGEEASGVAYNWDTDTLFVIGDGGQSVTQVLKTGALVNTMTLALGGSPQGTEFYDPEGITYIGSGQFVFTEERDRQAVKFTYAPGTTLTRAATQTVKLGTTIGNIGLEGLCYDPQTSGFLFVKESGPLGIFQTTIDFTALTASNGSPTTVNSTDLFDPALAGTLDMSDVFAFSNLPSMTGQPQSGNLLIISQASAQIVNVSRAGAVSSSLTLVSDPGNISIQDQTHEGVVMDPTGQLYVVSEAGGGTASFPQVWVYSTTTATNQAPTAVALNNTVTSLPENTNTSSAVKIADIGVTDDGLGTNTLSVTGTDASFFEITGNALFLKAGTVLNFLTKPSYGITVQVDDTSVGNSPDATVNHILAITAAPVGTANLIISEVASWSSGNSTVASDWFEVTNIGTATADITGWRMDDSGPSFANSVALSGITSIAPGESVIFIELSGKSAQFINVWFGGIAPAGLQFGTYHTGTGVGLSTGGDALNLFDSGGTIRANVVFGSNAPLAPGPFRSFDNAAGANNATITTLSSTGVNGAYSVSDTVVVSPPTIGSLIGSPGTIAGSTPIITIVATDAAAAEEGANTGTFRVSRTGSLIGPLTANFSVATGAGQATAADFTPVIGSSVVIPSSASFVDVTITPVFDSLGEGNETLTLTLFDTGGYDVGSPDSATVTIADSRFGTWLLANGYTSAGIDSDSDGDGFTDRTEFFFNQNPNNGGGFANLPQLFPNGGALELDFTRLNSTGGTIGTLEISSDLNTWTNALAGIDYTVISSVPTGDETAFTYALPGTGPSAPSPSPTYLTPNTSDPVGASLGGVRVVNEGLVGVGRISGESLDAFGETMGAASGLFISGWQFSAGQFSGKFNILPDRGYNTTTPTVIFSNYAARLHEVDFTFVPYYGTTAAGQGQIAITDAIPNDVVTTRFTYLDENITKFTTGLNPTSIAHPILGQTVGTVTAANGPGGASTSLLSFDAEAVHLFDDGSGFVSDEYGTYIARFNAAKQITGITQLPESARPHSALGVLNFTSTTPAPISGRRVNQGLEGMSVTPDGSLLFALMQSALVHDTGAGAQGRNHTRLFVYNVAGANRETPVLVGEYVVRLPQIDSNGNSSGLDATAAQSEIVALNGTSFLMLPRDGNGMGKGTTDPIVFKSVQLVDLASATNILGLKDDEGEQISPGGTLIGGVNAAATAEIINMLEPTDLAKFGLNAVTNLSNSNTLNEKMEGMALVSDLSTPQANDFFLFIANDNDFQSSNVKMIDAAGNLVSHGDGRLNKDINLNGITNDAMFYAYRITIDSGDKKFFRFGIK